MKNKKALKRILVNIPIYGMRVFVIRSEKHLNVLCNYLNADKSDIIPDNDGTDGRAMEYVDRHTGEIVNIIWISETASSFVLSHECIHAAINILDHVGIPILAEIKERERGDEAFAYLHTWLYKKVCKKLKMKL